MDDMELVLPDPVANGNQTGVVTAIHVKSAATAPAQFVAVEWSGKPGDGNPFPSGVMALSQQVTLQPGINNFNTNLPVDRRLASNGYESWTVVSLNILDGSSPIPAQSGGSFATTGLLLDAGRPLTATTADLTLPPHNVAVGGLPPATLLMSGDVTITTGQNNGGDNGGNNGGDNGGHDTTTHPLAIPSTARVAGASASLPLHCVGTTACTGTIRIQSRPGTRAAAKSSKKPKAITYATAHFSIPAGASKVVHLRLSRNGRNALKRRHSLKAYVLLTLGGSGASSSTITLRR